MQYSPANIDNSQYLLGLNICCAHHTTNRTSPKNNNCGYNYAVKHIPVIDMSRWCQSRQLCYIPIS